MEIPVPDSLRKMFSSVCFPAESKRAFLVLDTNGTIKYGSPEVGNYLCNDNNNPTLLIGQSVADIFPALQGDLSWPESIRSHYIFSPESDNGFEFEFVGWNRREGREVLLKASLAPLEIEDRRFFLLELFVLASEDNKLHKFLEVSEFNGDAVAVTTVDELIEYVNPAFEELTGYRKAAMVGRTHAVLNSGMQEPQFFVDMWKALRAGRTFRGIFVNRRQNGSIFYEDKIIRPYYNARGKMSHFIASGRDVSERIQIMHRLEHLANHDCLTGLPNRNLFLDRLRQAEARGSRNHEGFSVVVMDLDHFKAINDTLGHAVGDVVLQTAACRIRQCLREEDTVARLGGDEFSLILTEISSTRDVMNVVEKIVVLLSEPLAIDGRDIPLQASIGIAIYPEHGEDGHTLLKHADNAMYQAKTAGGNDFQIFEGKEKEHFIFSLQKKI
ncbi:diguanylate cyclase/phosphodiesterase [Sulfuriferula multivorans]|uniref:Diguanylate cyclase/phosphodiesterase n=1 Tax=Sulfuriferula multivorans TaxID=1559896 RepID=A0A401JD10_9PROT|nr:diguanylate cyclase [Sulfuriferula multivorans]GBL45558.1 diguanylate cyclase/phosphodiesterase [Sulfuriferula multivorans]